MDKSTLSNYGWLVIVTLILAVMLAFATPFGTYVGDGVVSVANGIVGTSNDATAEENISQSEVEWAVKTDHGIEYNTFKYYNTLEDAIEAVNNNSYITASSKLKNNNVVVGISKDGNAPVVRLIKDVHINITNTIPLKNSLIIDLNGHTFSINNSVPAFSLSNNLLFSILDTTKSGQLECNYNLFYEKDYNLTKIDINFKDLNIVYNNTNINSEHNGLFYCYVNKEHKNNNNINIENCNINFNSVASVRIFNAEGFTVNLNNINVNAKSEYLFYGFQIKNSIINAKNMDFNITINVNNSVVKETKYFSAIFSTKNTTLNVSDLNTKFVGNSTHENAQSFYVFGAHDDNVNANNIVAKINSNGYKQVNLITIQDGASIVNINNSSFNAVVKNEYNNNPNQYNGHSGFIVIWNDNNTINIKNCNNITNQEGSLLSAFVDIMGCNNNIYIDNSTNNNLKDTKMSVAFSFSKATATPTASDNNIYVSNFKSESLYSFYNYNDTPAKTNSVYLGKNTNIIFEKSKFYNNNILYNIINTDAIY